MDINLINNCQNCYKKFGVQFSLGLMSSVKICRPFKSNSCLHKLCEECLEGLTTCPVCPTNKKKACFQVDIELLGQVINSGELKRQQTSVMSSTPDRTIKPKYDVGYF